jgi:hypothetical protein
VEAHPHRGADHQALDSTFRIPDDTIKGKVEYDDTAEAGKPGAKNTSVLAGFETLMDDRDEEDNTAF